MLEGYQAGGLGHLLQPAGYMREYIAECPKQGRKRFNSIAKTIYIADLVIIYLWPRDNIVNVQMMETKIVLVEKRL